MTLGVRRSQRATGNGKDGVLAGEDEYNRNFLLKHSMFYSLEKWVEKPRHITDLMGCLWSSS